MPEPYSTFLTKRRSIFIGPWTLFRLPETSIPLTDELVSGGVPTDATRIALHKKAPARVRFTHQIETQQYAGDVAPVKAFLNLASMEITLPSSAVGDTDGDGLRKTFSCGLMDSSGAVGKSTLTTVTPVPICLVGRNRNPHSTLPWLIVAMYGAYCEDFGFDLEHDLFSQTDLTLKGMYFSEDTRNAGIGRIFPLAAE